mmetsp:Transcript_74381/g.240580  ORF Transcript_74381/g.240580 Transcript_74381/m.240580 type:complete len:348 (+) Transcript_74381:92-1135(+)
MRGAGALCAVLWLLLSLALGDAGYLFASSPPKKAVYYARLLTASEQARDEHMKWGIIMQAGHLEQPMGVAVDSFRRLLYVADPGSSAVLAMYFSEDHSKPGHLSVDAAHVVLSNIKVHWVAVDSKGSLFCSDSIGSRIWHLPVALVLARLEGASAEDSSVEPTELHSAEGLAPVVEPQGLAVNGLHVFWANGQGGKADGAVVRGPQEHSLYVPVHYEQLANSTDGAYGICLSGSRIFFTDAAARVYSIRPDGSDLVTVTQDLQEPRGCAYDGDGTIFIADAALGAVYSFSGGGMDCSARPVSRAFMVPGAYGLAVSTSRAAARGLAAFVVPGLLAACGLLPRRALER